MFVRSLVFAVAFTSFAAAAQDSKPYGSHDSITSGSGAAAAGTNLYNSTIGRSHPLPVHGGDDAILRGTIRGLGEGKSVGDAWRKAAEDETRIPKATRSEGSGGARR